jgi:NDP-sugar pyrophosphorylase family protein
MNKQKIAISVDAPLLHTIDGKVDGQVIRSRSQAIEYFLRKGLREELLSTAVIMIKGDHQHHLLSAFKGKTLLEAQLDFFKKSGFSTVLIVTQHTKQSTELLEICSRAPLSVEIIESEAKGNARALLTLKNRIKGLFLVMSGDTYNNFDIAKMIKKQHSLDSLAVMGLMTRAHTEGYGTAILDGDYVVEFAEKPKESSTTIVNAGVYLFKQEIFEMMEHADSLERDIFPKLARLKQLVGFFTYGEYEHFG